MQPPEATPRRAAPGHFWSDLRACLGLAGYCLGHLHVLRKAAYRYRFLSLFLDTGRKGMGDGGLRAVAIGTLLIAFMVRNLSANAEIAIQVLVLFVVREIGPLLAALVVLVRIGTALSADISVMALRGEVRSLRLLGLPVRDYLAVPAVLAIACSTMALTFYFQLTTVAGGIVVSAVLLDLSIRQMFEYLALALAPVDVAYTALKSFVFGWIIATVNAYYGMEMSKHTPGSLAEMLSRSVMQSLSVLLLFNAAFAYLVYGVLFAGPRAG
jgi:phospholipid/cholesterol/gamma-HCH transport system permease protein